MDKDNIFKSCSFYLDDGDVIHVLIKDFVGDSLSISLNDNDGTQEDDTEITPYGELYTGDYGALYNWYAAADSRNICSAGSHIPTKSEWDTLVAYLGGWAVAGGKLKEIGTVYWATDSGATNEVGFNARGSGYRYESNGAFISIHGYLWFHTAENYIIPNIYGRAIFNSTNMCGSWNITSEDERRRGTSLRTIKDSTILTHGQTGIYTGNDGNIYPTICIGTQEWMACNLAETEFRNGELIPNVEDNGAWAVLVTAGMCYYNNVEI